MITYSKIFLTYAKDVAKYKPLKRAEEIALGHRIRSGDKSALHALVNANMRFVVSVAHHYQSSGVPIMDLISAGNVGAIEAAKRYDPDKGFKFISYAAHWIRLEIIKVIGEMSRIWALPRSATNRLISYRRIDDALTQQYQRDVTSEEILVNMYDDEMSIDIAAAILPPVKLDATNDDGARTVDNMASPIEEQSGEELEHLQHKLDAVLKTLTKKERMVLQRHFGDNLTLQQVADNLGVSKQRIGELSLSALKKARLSAKRLMKAQVF